MDLRITDKGIILLDVGGTFIKGGLSSSEGKLAEDVLWQMPIRSEGSRDEILDALALSLRRGIGYMNALGMEAAGLAATFPGPFDYRKGIPLMEHKFRSIYGINLKTWISSLQGIPEEFQVSFIHDVVAQLFGEMSAGAAKGFRNVCVITLGTGLGFACSRNGEIQLSPTASPARSLYNMPYKDGILEDYVSKRGFLRTYRELHPDDQKYSDIELTVRNIGLRADAGEPEAIRTFSCTAAILADAVKPLLEENGTECLLLGGQISRSFRHMEKALKEGLSDVRTLKRISVEDHIDKAALYGSFAAFAKEHPDSVLQG